MINYFENTIRILRNSLQSIDEAIYNQLIQECCSTIKSGNKLIVSGLGKNVPICDKFVGTLLSLGFNAGFLHTNSAVHGDMGMVKPGDLVMILTKSGSTTESVYLADLLQKRAGVNLWLLSFSKNSILHSRIHKSLIIDLKHEGDLWDMVPNNSTTLYLILLQALGIELARKFNLTLADFKINHPGGAIGQMLKDK